jgi:DNA modification methylase
LFKQENPIIYFKSSENMEEIEGNSIQLIITSPPYGKIKDYGSDGQIGFLDSFEEYFKRLKNVWSECYRVIEPQCRLIINVGDQYLRTSQYGRYRILSIASRIISDCIDLGFDFLGDIIWQKVSTTNTTGGCSLMGSIYYPRNGLLTYDYEHILIFKKYKGKEKKVDRQIKELSKIPLSEWKKWYVGHWRFIGIIQKEHIAMFPDELPYRLIRMFSFIGDTILDPFLGSGTTLKVAKSLFRKGIGYEINNNFKETINDKINQGKVGIFKDFQYLLYKIYQKSKKENFSINYENQKQKGIIILKNKDDVEIILDYLLLDNDKFYKEFVLEDLKSKFEENPIQYYIHKKKKWENYKNYIIIINSNLSEKPEFNDLIENFLNNSYKSKNIQIISFNQIILKNFNILNLFNEHNTIKFYDPIKSGNDILSFV